MHGLDRLSEFRKVDGGLYTEAVDRIGIIPYIVTNEQDDDFRPEGPDNPDCIIGRKAERFRIYNQ
jgi:hypothetical protein